MPAQSFLILANIESPSKWLKVAFCAAVVYLLPIGISAGQQQPAGTQQSAKVPVNEAISINNSTEPAQSEPQLQIAQQSAGLLQMARDLKLEIDRAPNDTLSIAAFRKADAIERFTHVVKDASKRSNRKR